MDPAALVVPLPPDCVAMRDAILERGLPPIWQLDAETARALHLEGNLMARAAWTPAVDALPVDMESAALDGRIPVRTYRHRDRRTGVTIAWIHGGGWVLGGLETADAICRTICDATGHRVVSIDYRCAPWHPFPAAVDDCVDAVGHLLDAGDRIVVAGDSAGGTLAAVCAQRLGGLGRLAAQVLIYPATDPALRSASAHSFVEGPFLTRRDMEWFYAQYLPEGAQHDPRADLTGSVGAGARVPAVVITVGHDPLRDEGIAYAESLVAAGARVTWLHAPELYHGSITQSGVLPSAAARLDEVLAAMNALLD